nr:branched-chain amino acid ABC transporter permease [Jiangella mangrovi]
MLQGGLYATIALAFSLAWRITGVLNLAHGELVTAGAYLAWLLHSARWLPPLPSLLVVVPVLVAAGWLLERLVLRRLGAPTAGAAAAVLGTLGLSVVLQQAARLLFSPTPHTLPLPVGGLWRVGGVTVAAGHAVLFLVAAATAGAVVVLLRATRLGASLRAVAQNPEAARLAGIDVPRMRSLGFALCAGVAGVAGVLAGQAQPIHPAMGTPLLLGALAVTALTGPGHVTGAVLGGLALGVAEGVLGAVVPRVGATLGVVLAAALLVVMLVIRRDPLLATPVRGRP